MGKYDQLWEYIRKSDMQFLKLTFDDIRDIQE